jgi:hypothetical protein
MLTINNIEPKDGEVWHPWWLLEEVKHNMWGDVSHRKTWLEIAIAFTGNHELYGEWMLKVADQWEYSCQHNLTKSGDKRPWIGHAAVALAIGCPEDVVRQAWAFLTEDQQAKANQKATDAIEYWRLKNA